MTRYPIVAVIGGCGGAGASLLAAALAARAAAEYEAAFLIDCDPVGGGLDVLLGCERAPGTRWGQVRLRGGRLDPVVLRDCLPRWHQVSVLAVDHPPSVDAGALVPIVEAAAQAGPVVLDLARWACAVRSAALAGCDLAVLVTPAEVRAVTASAAIAGDLDPARAAAVIRGSAPALPALRIGQLLGLPVVGELGYEPAGRRPGGLDPGRFRRRTGQLAEAVLRRAVGAAEQAAA